MLGNDDDKPDAGINRLYGCVLDYGCGHKEYRNLCPMPGHGLSNRIIHGNALYLLTPFARGDTGNNIGPVFLHPFSLGTTYPTGNALH